MNWITGIGKAIGYIEENLTEDIDYGEAAKRAGSSVFHFSGYSVSSAAIPLVTISE